MTTFQKALALLTPREKRRALVVLVLVIGLAMLETAGIASVMPFLAVLGNPDMIQTNSTLNALFRWSATLGIETHDDFLIALGLAAFGIILISAVYRGVAHFALNRFIEMRRNSISTRLLMGYLRQPYTFYLGRHSGDLSKVVLSEVDMVIRNVYRPAYNMLAYSLVLLSIVALIIMVNPWMALMAVTFFGLLYGLVIMGLRRKLTQIGHIQVRGNKARFMTIAEVFGGIKPIKVLGRELEYHSRFSRVSKQLAQAQSTLQTLNQVPHYLIEALIFGTILLLTIFLLVTSGGLEGGALGQILPTLGLYAFAAYRMKPAVGQIYQGFSSLQYGRAIMDGLFEDWEQQTGLARIPEQAEQPLVAKTHIALDNLTFSYPQAERPALYNLNLQIPVGTSVGLVGATGAGKTTLVDVLLGLLQPTSGSLRVDDLTVTSSQIRAWQKGLGYVPQEIFLTDATVKENIALGLPPARIDFKKVQRCAEMAQIHEFVTQELPQQYDTLVGERGVRLSGGQRQRIGIARALYHNPDILVFDEATSALDTLTEQALMDAIDSLAGTKTIILIAHRLSTVKNCDQIVLLDKGRMTARGTYSELVAGNTQFRAMAR